MSHQQYLFNAKVIEFTTNRQAPVKRLKYLFMVQTKYLTERQIYAEAFLRGLISGQEDDAVTVEIKNIIDIQMRQDFEKFIQTRQDLTPIFMNHRATMKDATTIVKEVFNEFSRLKCVGASVYALGVQLEFAVNCLKRTLYAETDNLDQIQHFVDEINKSFQQIVMVQSPGSVNLNATQTSAYMTAQNQSAFGSSFNSPQAPAMNATFSATPNYSVPLYQPMQANVTYAPSNTQMPIGNSSSPRAGSFYNNYASTSVNQNRNQMAPNMNPVFERTNQNGSILNCSANSGLIGPHKVSSTIVNIISKNTYEVGMDALDQLETWEAQADSLLVPIDYFLSYMEVLLSKNVQGWWRVYRPHIKTWDQFKSQFIEDFGDQNRVIKAEQEIAKLAQGPDETFQELFLRFTKLMGYVKPPKSLSDQVYILRSALRPSLRTACMTAQSIAEIKRICYEYEGIDKMSSSRKTSTKFVDKVNVVELDNVTGMEIDHDFWNSVTELDNISDDDDVVMIVDEIMDKKRTAIMQQWSDEKKREWLGKQLCWNCDVKGHLQGQCNKKWIPHCAKCGNKQAASIKECSSCSGNGKTLTQQGAQR